MSPASPDVEVFVTVEPVATVAVVIDPPEIRVVTASNITPVGASGGNGSQGPQGPPGPEGPPGPPGIEWVGSWDVLNHYMPNYGVTYDGSSFIALEEIFGDPGNPLPPDDYRWLILAQAGSEGPQGDKGDAGTAGATGLQGPAGAQGPQGAPGPGATVSTSPPVGAPAQDGLMWIVVAP